VLFLAVGDDERADDERALDDDSGLGSAQSGTDPTPRSRLEAVDCP
jgi:hypothetical protein